jgi:nicotinate-nucleotide adenylyltransferase
VKLAILGGTFNPVHLGHLFLAHEIRHDLGYDTILFVPAHLPVHKGEVEGVQHADRLEMLRLALEGRPGMALDDCEIRRGGVSYTIDTVEHVRAQYDVDGKPGLVIGDDLASDFRSWRKAEELADLADIVVVHRLSDARVSLDVPHRYCDNLRLPISSSALRRRLAEGRPVVGLVPDSVLEYIRKHRLYDSHRGRLNAPGANGYSA